MDRETPTWSASEEFDVVLQPILDSSLCHSRPYHAPTQIFLLTENNSLSIYAF